MVSMAGGGWEQRDGSSGPVPPVFRVLHLITTLEPDGAQTQVLDLVRSVVRSGAATSCDMRIGYLAGPGSARASYADIAERIVDFSRAGGRLDPLSPVRIAAHLRAGSYAVVHTHLVHAGIVGHHAARLAGTPALVGTRHYAFDDKEGTCLYRYADRLLGRADGAVAVSAAVREHVLSRHIASADRVAVIPNGIDTDLFAPPSIPDAGTAANNPAPIIGCAGRLHPQKGHADLIRAFREVVAARPEARLEILGEGPLRGDLVRLVADLGLEGSVAMPGRIARAEMPSRVARWTCCAMPSLWEGFGVAAAEAMALGKPVVASRVEGLAELIEDGATGWLVPPGDPAALSSRLIQALRDPVTGCALGQRAAASVRSRYPISRSANALLGLYRRLLSACAWR